MWNISGRVWHVVWVLFMGPLQRVFIQNQNDCDKGNTVKLQLLLSMFELSNLLSSKSTNFFRLRL